MPLLASAPHQQGNKHGRINSRTCRKLRKVKKKCKEERGLFRTNVHVNKWFSTLFTNAIPFSYLVKVITKCKKKTIK
jgi:hypothetical protein